MTRNGLIIGLIIGIGLGGVIWAYPLYSKISALESQIEKLEKQTSMVLDITEFQLEVLFFQSLGVVIDYCFWPLNGTIGVPLESYLYRPEYYPSYNITVLNVTKVVFRNRVFDTIYQYGRFVGSISANYGSETLYAVYPNVILAGNWTLAQLDVQILCWSPSTEG